jgi:hypothetical protein
LATLIGREIAGSALILASCGISSVEGRAFGEEGVGLGRSAVIRQSEIDQGIDGAELVGGVALSVGLAIGIIRASENVISE